MYFLLLFFFIQEGYPKKTYVNMFCDDLCLELYINGIFQNDSDSNKNTKTTNT